MLFDDGCCEAGPLLDRRRNDGCIALNPPDVLRSNVRHVQLHRLDTELRRPFQNNGAAGDLVNRGPLCDAHNVLSPLLCGEFVNVEAVIGGHAAHNANIVRRDMDDINV